MTLAIVTALFYAIGSVFSTRLSRIMGPLPANFWRLLTAALILGAITWGFFPQSFSTPVFLWLLLSGFVGFGIGDAALFIAYSALGSRLSLLFLVCLGPVFGAVIEYQWLGTRISQKEIIGIGVILLGIIIALLPSARDGLKKATRAPWGFVFATLAAVGQAIGAVLTRNAVQLAEVSDLTVPGISQAFQRSLGGLVFSGLAYAIWTTRGLKVKTPEKKAKFVPFWFIGTALFGPVIGVSCFQGALTALPSAIVLAVIAITPLLVMPLARLVEKDTPSPSALIGTIVAVGGVVYLCLSRM